MSKAVNIPALIQRGDGRYSLGQSLYLVVRGGSARFEYQFRDGVARRSLWLGSAIGPAAVTLTQARVARAQAWADRRNHAPVRAPRPRVTATAGVPFGQAVRSYMDGKADEWGARQRKHMAKLIELHAKAIEARALPAITVQDVATVLRPVWTGPNHSQGGRLRSLIERTFRANLIEPNPAEWDRLKELRDPQGKPVLATKTVEAESFANMPYDELPALMGELAADQSEPGRALRFLILTAARSAEVIGADWNEIDMAARTWTIPPEKMKAGRKHIIPLSDAALAGLGPQGDGAVFAVTNTRNGRLNANALYKHLLGYRSGITAHGMRSTFATWAQNAGYPIPVIDVALAHKEKNRTRRAYLRSEYLPERRKLMADWASFASPT